MQNSSSELIELNSGQNLFPNKIFRTEKRAFCIQCDKPNDLMSFDDVAEKLKTNFREVFRLANIGKLHRLHNENGKVMICLDSLLQVFEARQTKKLNPDLFITNPTGEIRQN